MKKIDQLQLYNQVEIIRQHIFSLTKGEVEEISLTVETGDRFNYKISFFFGRDFEFEGPDLEYIFSRIEITL